MKNPKKIFVVILAVILIMSTMSVSVFAAEGGSTPTQVEYSDVKPLIDTITQFFSVSTIVGILAGVLTTVMVFVFLWWAVRKVTKIAMAAIRKGRVST